MKPRALGIILLAAASLAQARRITSEREPVCGRDVARDQAGARRDAFGSSITPPPEERTLRKVPTTEFNREQSAASRAAIEALLAPTRAQLWIQHDFAGDAKLNKSPRSYDSASARLMRG